MFNKLTNNYRVSPASNPQKPACMLCGSNQKLRFISLVHMLRFRLCIFVSFWMDVTVAVFVMISVEAYTSHVINECESVIWPKVRILYHQFVRIDWAHRILENVDFFCRNTSRETQTQTNNLAFNNNRQLQIWIYAILILMLSTRFIFLLVQNSHLKVETKTCLKLPYVMCVVICYLACDENWI